MKKLWFLLLAVCLIGFLTGCDSGGGGGSSSNDNGGGNGGGGNSDTMIYIITDLVDHSNITGSVTKISGGIRYTLTTPSEIHEDTVKLTVDTKAYTFRIDQKLVNVTTSDVSDVIYTGTFTLSGKTINATITLTHDNQTDTDTPGSQPETFTIDGDTITGADWEWIFTLQ